MDRDASVFGRELRRRREAAGLSLAGLANLVHYSKSHLSKVEHGLKPPSEGLARRCDHALHAGGELAGLAAPRTPPPPQDESAGDPDEVWTVVFDGGDVWFRAASRRQVISASAAGLGLGALLPAAYGLGRPAASASAVVAAGKPDGGQVIDGFQAMLRQSRSLGQVLAPADLLPMLLGPTRALRRVAEHSSGGERDAMLLLAARFAEYTGWIAQEAGDDPGALWWTDRAVEYAAMAGQHDMAAYALVRRGLIALYRHDGRQTVELAQQAQRATRDPRIRGLAAQREAQGLAVLADRDGAMRALDRAADLLSTAASEANGGTGADPTPLGSTHVADPVQAARGWCLYDLGDTRRAADTLREQYAAVPATALRARARFGARFALALAADGEAEESAFVTAQVLEACAQVDSATVRVDLRALARELNRLMSVPTVAAVRGPLSDLLGSAR
jgi:transcriptional regulator with XRE-family HTH domain/tetratricopeptide (TPR) repeat protein